MNKLTGIFSKGYGIIPKAFMKDKEISKNAKLIMAYFLSFTGGGKIECYPKVETITEDLGIARATFFKSIKELEELNLLSKVKKIPNSPIQSNKYIIKMIDFTQSSPSELPRATNVTTQSSASELSILNNNILNNNKLNNRKESKDSYYVETSSTSSFTEKKGEESESKSTPYKEVFEFYQTLGLIKHRKYIPAMRRAMEKAKRDLGVDAEEMKRMLQRHKDRVETSKGFKVKGESRSVKARTLSTFFGQTKCNSIELICAEYTDDAFETKTYSNKGALHVRDLVKEEKEQSFALHRAEQEREFIKERNIYDRVGRRFDERDKAKEDAEYQIAAKRGDTQFPSKWRLLIATYAKSPEDYNAKIAYSVKNQGVPEEYMRKD